MDEEIRLDKWLWAARFFKTRSLAAEAASDGKVEIHGDRPKPSRLVRAGDKLTIRRGPYEWTIIVTDVSRLRGPAAQAQQLFVETEESLRQREAAIVQLKLERPPEFDSPGRPSKKDRRAIARVHQTRLVKRLNCEFDSLTCQIGIDIGLALQFKWEAK